MTEETQQDTDAQGATEDTEAQELLADAVADEEKEEAEESTLDPKAKAALDKARREARNLRQRLKDLEPAARELKEIKDKDKTESQKLTDQLGELQKKIARYELREAQVAAASAAGLPASMAQFINATDPDEAKAQAKQLAEFGKAGLHTDFKQGARKTTPTKATGDEWLRRMAGRQ